MKVIKLLVGLFFVCTAVNSFAQGFQKKSIAVSCSVFENSSVLPERGSGGAVILHVNGMNSTIDEAEQARAAIERTLGCQSCSVQKFHNRDDGFWVDVRELSVGVAWEEAAIKLALSGVRQDIKSEYLYHLSLWERIGDGSLAGYTTDELMTDAANYLRGLEGQVNYEPRKDGTEVLGPFVRRMRGDLRLVVEAYGRAVMAGGSRTMDSLRKRSVVLMSLIHILEENKRGIVNFKYLERYRSYLSEIYYSDRRFYGGNAKAAATLSRSVEDLKSTLVQYVGLGYKVVVTAHSQGNHLIGLAYSSLQSERGQDFVNAIRVVGIGSVSGFSPNNVYYTFNWDPIIQHMHGGKWIPLHERSYLAPNFIGSSLSLFNDLSGHGFLDIYISPNVKGKYTIPANAHDIDRFSPDVRNSTRDISMEHVFRYLVMGSIAAARPVHPPRGITPLMSAHLLLEGPSGLRLRVNEPDSHHVYSGQTSGVFGRWFSESYSHSGGRSDFYVTTKKHSCEDFVGKEWLFFAHYPIGSEQEVKAQFSISILNAPALSVPVVFSRGNRSYSTDASVFVPIGSVKITGRHFLGDLNQLVIDIEPQ